MSNKKYYDVSKLYKREIIELPNTQNKNNKEPHKLP